MRHFLRAPVEDGGGVDDKYDEGQGLPAERAGERTLWQRVRRLFAPPREPRRSAEDEFGESLLLTVDPGQLASGLIGQLQRVAPIGEAFVYVPDRSDSPTAFSLVDEAGSAHVQVPDLPVQGRAVRWFEVNREFLLFDRNADVVRYMGSEIHALRDAGADLALPLMSRDRLIGLVFLGLVQGSPDDRELAGFRDVSRQAGLAFENALLFRERLRQNERMFRAEQLATLGQFAAGIAHEVRNPLTAIRSTVQYFSTGFEEGSQKKQLAADMLEEVDRLDKLVDDLLSFARPSAAEPEELNPAHEIESCLSFISAQAGGQNVTLDLQADDGLPCLLWERGDLRQLLLNVLVNGLQAMPDGGKLSIRASCERGPGSPGRPLGERLLIEIQDEGPGMSSDVRRRAFEPFFTTKPGGTGLGLAICAGIVRRHDGDIWIEDADGGGSVVRIALPVGRAGREWGGDAKG